jgi:hypothetical protein
VSAARPVLRVDRARLANARPGDRARLADALALASPAATGVHARELLLIRRLRMERPLAAGAEAFASELVDRIRAARVEARTRAGQGANSVHFKDDAALECAIVAAWLAGDALPGPVRDAIPESVAPRLRWRRRILTEPAKLPHLIAALVEAGIAGPWLAHFEEAELRTAADLLVRAYGGGQDAPPAAISGDLATGSGTSPSRPAAKVESIEAVIALARRNASAPAAIALIAISLLATRRPELIGTKVFAARRAAMAIESRSASPLPATDRARLAGQTISAEPGPVARKEGRLRTGAPVPADGGQSVPDVPVARALDRHTAPTRPIAAPATPPPPLPIATQTSAASAPAPIFNGVESAHAGLFFLLNVFLALGLYGDFSDPVRRLRGLSPFELMLLLGRRWIGSAFAADPLEPALRSLAGLTPRERVGRNFEAPVWAPPEDWLTPWPGARMRVRSGRFGSSKWHPAGFPAGDHWHTPRAQPWLRRRWVACLARYLEARIARALASADRAALATLLHRAGSVHVEPGQVQVAFALDAHPLAIRLAGLDRDPGWIPAAGRTIAFRFT